MPRTTIRAEDITDDQITTDTIAVGAVNAQEIGANAVDTSEIAANAVTPAQMANSAFLANRNKIINGAMQIAQRGTSTTAHNAFIVDRIQSAVSNLDQLVCTYSQDSSGADGFANSYKINVGTAETTIDADEFLRVLYLIEAQDLQDLKYGNAAAESVTLSFYVKSNVTGVYGFAMFGDDGSRLIGGTYTISASATWEKKTLTFAGDIAGTMNDDNGSGLRLCFWLIAGTDYTSGSSNTSWMASVTASVAYGHAVNLGSAINNYWQITGVQLEIGTTATPFEHKTFGQELAACQRYYQTKGIGLNAGIESASATTGTWRTGITYDPPMRAAPTVAVGTGTITINRPGVAAHDSISNVIAWNSNPTNQGTVLGLGNYNNSGGAAGSYGVFSAGGNLLTFDAEL